jgi:hypothetical protein
MVPKGTLVDLQRQPLQRAPPGHQTCENRQLSTGSHGSTRTLLVFIWHLKTWRLPLNISHIPPSIPRITAEFPDTRSLFPSNRPESCRLPSKSTPLRTRKPREVN